MNELKIEQGIPIPECPARNSGVCAALRKLKVGESVVVPAGRNRPDALARYAIGGGKYACRKVENGYRIWRTK